MAEVIFIGVFALLILASAIRPPVAIAAVLYGYTIEQLAQAHTYYFIQHSWIGNVAVGLSVLFALIAKQLKGEQPLSYPSSTLVSGWILFLYCIASTTWSKIPGGLGVVVNFAPYLAISIIIGPLLIQSVNELRHAMKISALVGAALFIALSTTTSLAEWGRKVKLAESDEVITSEIDKKGKGGNPLAVASSAGYAAICVAFVRLGRMQTLFTIARWGLIALFLIVIVRSGSRGQLLAALAAIGLFMPIHLGINDLGKLLRLSVAGVIFFAVTFVIYKAFIADSSRWDLGYAQEQLSTGRLYFWSTMLKAWMTSNPINLLLGLGSFSSRLYLGTYPHNLTIELLTEQGLIGFTIYVFLIGSAAYAFRRLLSVYTSPEDRSAIVILAALAFFELLLHQKQGAFFGIKTLYVFLIGLGQCYAFSRSPRGREQINSARLQSLQLMRVAQA